MSLLYNNTSHLNISTEIANLQLLHKFAILSYMKSLTLTRPHLIVMVGIPGSGKSFFAEKFANTFHAPYISFQEIISIAEVANSTARRLVHYQLRELLKTSQTIIVDTEAGSRTERAELSKLGREVGYETLFIWVQIDQQTAKSRYVKTAKPSEKLTLATLYDKRMTRFTPPSAVEKSLVISGKHTYATQAKIVLTKLSTPRAAISSHTTPVTRVELTGRRNIKIG
jgi:predicted kinase